MSFNNYETDRLILKPTDQSDAPFVFQLMNSPNWIKLVRTNEQNAKIGGFEVATTSSDPFSNGICSYGQSPKGKRTESPTAQLLQRAIAHTRLRSIIRVVSHLHYGDLGESKQFSPS